LLADSGHNLGDVLSLSLAWGVVVLSRRRHTTIQIELADTDEAGC
jgi:Co/Zn/Cd efflux system component